MLISSWIEKRTCILFLSLLKNREYGEIIICAIRLYFIYRLFSLSLCLSLTSEEGVSNRVTALFVSNIRQMLIFARSFLFFVGRPFFSFPSLSLVLSKSAYIKTRIPPHRSIRLDRLYFSQSLYQSTEKRSNWSPEGLMVEVYTEPLLTTVQSVTGGLKYRLFKRQRIKLSIFQSSI